MLHEIRDHGLPLHGRFGFFPIIDSTISLPQQPRSIESSVDTEEALKPLAPFSEVFHNNVFGKPSALDSEICVPTCPANFTDRYLAPTLSRNEHIRLRMLWYYTRGLQDDAELLQKLSQILDMVKQSLGSFEMGIIGIVEAETFARIVATNIPLALLPRRESPCSHTINQHPGTVFTIQDMQEDWRFQLSPTAEHGGLRSYAGTQILLARQDAETISFGSLCIASRSVQPALDETQKDSLIRAANMISSEIVTRMRVRRMHERQTMMETLSRLRLKHNIMDFESVIVASINEHYSDCDIRTIDVIDGLAHLPGPVDIEICSIDGGLWEDEAFVKSRIETGDFPRSLCDRPVRAAIGSMMPGQKLLVLSTYNIRYIFDDLDVWFVDQCASILYNAQQARHLQEALAAKDKFLSTVRHELRTPIHGILSSTELLADELRGRNLLDAPTDSNKTSLSSFLRDIQSSGTELMTTVNNILRLQTIASQNIGPAEAVSIYDLNCLESDLLSEVLANYSEESLPGLSIRFQNDSGAASTIKVDWETLKEVLKALLFNAIAATQNGFVVLTTSLDMQTKTLCFDVVDNGTGIAKQDQERIFVAFEKLQEHSRGAGLGLSLAKMMAIALKGKLTLVSSQERLGSHFRLTIPYVEVNDRPIPARRWSRKAKHIPQAYYVCTQSKRNLHLLSHVESYLNGYGLQRAEQAQGALIITNEPAPLSTFDMTALSDTTETHLVLVVSSSVPSESQKASMCKTLHPHHVLIVTGPLYTSRLDDIFEDADLMLLQQKQPMASQVQSLSPVVKVQQSCNNISDTSMHSSEVTPPVTPGIELEKLVISSSTEVFTSAVPLKVLLVDDNKVNLSVLQMFCRRRMFDFGSAMNGNQAVQLYKAAVSEHIPYDLVLMDLQMPQCDGIEATKQIRSFELDSGSRRSIILIITGQDRPADRKASFDAGADEFFCKPVSMKRLSQSIAQHFEDKPSP